MTIHVLLKGTAKSGLLTFHGVTNNDIAAESWDAANSKNWHYAFEFEQESDEQVVSLKPITKGE